MYFATWRHQEVAVKELVQHSVKDEEEFAKEAGLMKQLRPHKNVIQLLGVCSSPFCIITEYVGGGTVLQQLQQATSPLSPVSTSSIHPSIHSRRL